jgi:hypothetical protein
MRIRAFTLAGAYFFLLCCLSASGQTASNDPSIHPTKAPKDADDTIAILEVGASTNWNFSGGAATFAPNLAAECTPIEKLARTGGRRFALLHTSRDGMGHGFSV